MAVMPSIAGFHCHAIKKINWKPAKSHSLTIFSSSGHVCFQERLFKAGFHWRRSRSRSQSASNLMKIENRSHKRSHKGSIFF